MIPGLPSVGGTELLILLTIVLLFFGAKRIPDLARSLGKGTREFREGIKGATSDPVKDEDEVGGRKEEDKEKSALGEASSRDASPRAEEEEAEATRAGREA